MTDTTTEDAERTVAVDTMVLWPHPYTDVDAARADTDPWPVLVLVVDDGAAALTEVLDQPRLPLGTVTNSYCWWSVDDPDRALLRLAVRVRRPVGVALDIAVPAQCLLGLADIVAAGATLAVTTRGRAERITARGDEHHALREVVLLGSRTSNELGLLANRLCREGPYPAGGR